MVDDVEAFRMSAEILKERGAYKIYVIATHGVLSSDAPRIIDNSNIDEVVVTNTVPHEVQKMQCHKIKTVDISSLLSESMRRIHNQESMSYLFKDICNIYWFCSMRSLCDFETFFFIFAWTSRTYIEANHVLPFAFIGLCVWLFLKLIEKQSNLHVFGHVCVVREPASHLILKPPEEMYKCNGLCFVCILICS